MKTKAFLIFLLAGLKACAICSEGSNDRQDSHVTIKENALVFYTLSSKEYDRLILKHPDWEQGIIECISDFLSYAHRIASALNNAGISVRFESTAEVWFEYANGTVEKKEFRPEELYGLAMFAKNKAPVIRSNFDANLQPMVELISKYFGLNIRFQRPELLARFFRCMYTSSWRHEHPPGECRIQFTRLMASCELTRLLPGGPLN